MARYAYIQGVLKKTYRFLTVKANFYLKLYSTQTSVTLKTIFQVYDDTFSYF